MVPVHVEPIPDLQHRYAAAIEEVINAADVVMMKRMAPSKDPKHVFDTPEGWRLIISRERMPDNRIGIHFSASIHDLSVGRLMQHSFQSPEVMIDAIVLAWREIANSTRTPILVTVTGGGIPHFFVEQDS